ncbi:hypothetical protein ACHAWF_001411, partial [Thalassiosira exigua]
HLRPRRRGTGGSDLLADEAASSGASRRSDPDDGSLPIPIPRPRRGRRGRRGLVAVAEGIRRSEDRSSARIPRRVALIVVRLVVAPALGPRPMPRRDRRLRCRGRRGLLPHIREVARARLPVLCSRHVHHRRIRRPGPRDGSGQALRAGILLRGNIHRGRPAGLRGGEPRRSGAEGRGAGAERGPHGVRGIDRPRRSRREACAYDDDYERRRRVCRRLCRGRIAQVELHPPPSARRRRAELLRLRPLRSPGPAHRPSGGVNDDQLAVLRRGHGDHGGIRGRRPESAHARVGGGLRPAGRGEYGRGARTHCRARRAEGDPEGRARVHGSTHDLRGPQGHGHEPRRRGGSVRIPQVHARIDAVDMDTMDELRELFRRLDETGSNSIRKEDLILVARKRNETMRLADETFECMGLGDGRT